MELTPAQHKAVYTHDQNVIVVAAAGSGKTSVLVNRYLALLDAHPEWPLNSLVAITFTQKAAQEMRDRVRQALEDRLVASRAQADAAIWAHRLAEMDSARIDTIHALCASILRANAAEAVLDPDFVVLDEVNARILLDTVLDDVLRAIVDEKHTAVRLFAEYDARAVRETLTSFVGVDLPDLPDNLFERWEARWREDCAAALDALLRDDDFIKAAQWEPPGAAWPQADKLVEVWEKCRPCLESLHAAESLEQRVDALRDLRDAIKLNVGGQAAWGGKDTLDAAKAALRALREKAARVLDAIGEPPGEIDQRAAELLPLWVSLLRRLQHDFRQAKRAASMLDFDDLERETRHLLKNFPSVRLRYAGAEFKHVLVDELQDTNEAQMEIIQALADPAVPGCLFLVGDPRQSIYAFRGADVSVFDRVRETIEEAGGDEVNMAESFRTHQALVDACNMLFARLLKRDPNSPVRDYQIELGEAVRAVRREAPGEGSFVELLLVDKQPEQDGEKLSAEENRRREAARLAERLKHMVEDEQRLIYDRRQQCLRPVGYGDIALLFQAMSNITIYEDVLKAARVPFVTVAGRGYYDRQEVWDLVNLLRALYNVADNLALASVLRSPMFSLSDDALLALRLIKNVHGHTLTLYEALIQVGGAIVDGLPVDGIEGDDTGRLQFAAECLGELAALAGRVTIAELLRTALDRTGYLATLVGLPDGARRRGNVEKLLEKAQTSGKITLGAFAQYLTDLTDYEVREGEALLDVEGAVTLMTVHKSKGLEFPVVVLVDTSWTGRPADPALLVHDKTYGLACKVNDHATNKLERPYAHRRADTLRQLREEAERRRLLYVAATRAQDYLLIGGQVKRTQDGQLQGDGWLKWLLEAMDLQTTPDEPEFHQEYAWGGVRVAVSREPAEATVQVDGQDKTAWDRSEVRQGQPIPDTAAAKPALLRELPPGRALWARELTATQMSDLGAMQMPGQEGSVYKRRLRRSLFHDAPATIETITARGRILPRRKIGRIVHRALRAWVLPGDQGSIEALLRGYAWEEGIVDEGQQQYAVQQAGRLLDRVLQTEIVRWIEDAVEVYREMPFAYHIGTRSVYGTTDVVFRRPDESWAVLDYKTSVVSRASEPNALEEHAGRYHLQMGLYAAALRDQLRLISGRDTIPDVLIHYINYTHTVAIPRADWEAALSRVEDVVADLVGPQS